MTGPVTSSENSTLLRASIWVAIGALIAAAIVCVVWVLVGDADGLIAKAFLTILLLAAFAGVAIAESNVATGRPAWLALASMTSWIIVLLIGAFFIWANTGGDYGAGASRTFRLVLIILILQGALLHLRLFLRAHERYRTTFTTVVTYVTVALVVALVVFLLIPLVFENLNLNPLYWRIVVALAILAAVGTALVPLVNALFAPKKPRPAAAAPHAYGAPQAWPLYADGRTPLPMLPDGSPDWQAYYTGRPSVPQLAAPGVAPAAQTAPAAPTAPGYQGYPPAPPVPPAHVATEQ